MKISGSIITFNEEDKLSDCLESLNICDEIVIVDSNSTDGTKKIVEKFAKKYSKNSKLNNNIKVKFITQKFLGYGPQKNYATSKCGNDWILSLDADERVSEQLRQSLLNLKQEFTANSNHPKRKKGKSSESNIDNGGNAAVAYEVNRLNKYVGSWIHYCGWYPDRRIRFFNKNFGSWSDVQVHELYETKGTVSHLNGDILHLSIDSISAHMSNIDRFTTLAAQQSFEKGKKAGIPRIIFQTFFTFIKMYLLKRGFLDGKAGFILSVMSAYYSFIKYTKLYYLNKK